MRLSKKNETLRNTPYTEVNLGRLFNIFTGKKNVNETDPSGKYTFFSCAPETFKSKDFIHDGEAIIIAGNGSYTGTTRYFNGKFDLYQRTYALTPKEKKLIDTKYIYYLLKNSFEPKFMGGTRGSSIPYIVMGDISDFEFTLPPLPEQKRIANILSSFDNKIELLREQNKTLANIAQTIFKQWFIDFNFPDSNGKPYKDNGGKMIDSELGLIPEGWEVGRLGDVIRLQGGFAFKSKDFMEDGDYGVVKIKNIQNNGIDKNDIQYIGKNIVREIDPKFILSSGSILVAMTGANIGKTGLLSTSSSEKYVLNQRVGLFFPLYLGSDYYTYLFMKYKGREIIESICAGSSAQPNISTTNIENIRICIPPKKDLHLYYKYFEEIKTKTTHNLYKISIITKIKSLSLKKLL